MEAFATVEAFAIWEQGTLGPQKFKDLGTGNANSTKGSMGMKIGRTTDTFTPKVPRQCFLILGAQYHKWIVICGGFSPEWHFMTQSDIFNLPLQVHLQNYFMLCQVCSFWMMQVVGLINSQTCAHFHISFTVQWIIVLQELYYAETYANRLNYL